MAADMKDKDGNDPLILRGQKRIRRSREAAPEKVYGISE